MIKHSILKEEDGQLFVYAWDTEKPIKAFEENQISYNIRLTRWQQSAKKYPVLEDCKGKLKNLAYVEWMFFSIEKRNLGLYECLKQGIEIPADRVGIILRTDLYKFLKEKDAEIQQGVDCVEHMKEVCDNYANDIEALKKDVNFWIDSYKEKDAEIERLKERYEKCCKSNDMYQLVTETQANDTEKYKEILREQSALLDEMANELKQCLSILEQTLHIRLIENKEMGNIFLLSQIDSTRYILIKYNQLKQKG